LRLPTIATPGNFIGKYATESVQRLLAFVFLHHGRLRDNINKPHSREITEQACRNCHGEIVGAIEPAHPAPAGGATRLPALPRLGGTFALMGRIIGRVV